ncbi:MAG: hypothetical protein K5945_02485, partial [Bacteroidaceae bacterium]|nr:hypothetical protein [Bacteroidaceae bacterium]
MVTSDETQKGLKNGQKRPFSGRFKVHLVSACDGKSSEILTPQGRIISLSVSRSRPKFASRQARRQTLELLKAVFSEP